MRLIKLSSSRASFKTVSFNRTGLSLVVAKHTAGQAQNIKSTYNGVGKSLLVTLLHFCLGANKNKQLEAHLGGWDFTLVFEQAGREFSVTRAVGDDKLLFEGVETKLVPFRRTLNELGIFDLPADIGGLTFRALINFFLRPTRQSYSSPESAAPESTPYNRVLYESFLLGLDYYRAHKKFTEKKRLDDKLRLAKQYKDDKELRGFYLREKNPEIELASLSDRIDKLQRDLATFAVARDYSDREATANNIRSQLLEARNSETILRVRLADIDAAMTVRPDVTPERLNQLYSEAGLSLPDKVKQRLEDVDAFHARLRENRRRRLESERRHAEAELKGWQEARASLERDLDGVLQYLKAHRALDEYTENNRFLAELMARRQKIQDYLELLKKYTQEAQEIRAEMTQDTLQTTQYLQEITGHTDRLMKSFRRVARQFYDDAQAGLTVRNNDNDKQIRYDIDARIEHDQADGINDVRIFCFDALVLALRQRHTVDFVFHDSRLFADMDWHQRLTLFRVAEKLCARFGFQYIATINEDHVESVRGEAGEEFDRLFRNTRILELTDEADGSGKLLGVQVEMSYEEDD